MADIDELLDAFIADMAIGEKNWSIVAEKAARERLSEIVTEVVRDTAHRLLTAHEVSVNDVRQVLASEEEWMRRIDEATSEVNAVYVKYHDILKRIVASADYFGTGWHWANVDWPLIHEAQELLRAT